MHRLNTTLHLSLSLSLAVQLGTQLSECNMQGGILNLVVVKRTALENSEMHDGMEQEKHCALCTLVFLSEANPNQKRQ